MSSESHFSKDDAYQALESVNSWISNVDAKISFALAYIVVLIGFIFYNAGAVPAAIQTFCDASARSLCMFVNLILVVLLYVSSIASIMMFLIALIGRTRSSAKKSFLFFGLIAKMNAHDYQSMVLGMDENEMTQDLIEQIHINSVICSKKFRYYNFGIYLLLTATALCFVCMVFQLI